MTWECPDMNERSKRKADEETDVLKQWVSGSTNSRMCLSEAVTYNDLCTTESGIEMKQIFASQTSIVSSHTPLIGPSVPTCRQMPKKGCIA